METCFLEKLRIKPSSFQVIQKHMETTTDLAKNWLMEKVWTISVSSRNMRTLKQ